MAVLGLLSLTLDVPQTPPGLRFYTNAGLTAAEQGSVARLRCPGQNRDSIILRGGAPTKRLHHLTLRADCLAEIAERTPASGGEVVTPPRGFVQDGLWVRDPHGLLLQLLEHPADSELAQAPRFEVNGPGRLIRKSQSAIRPIAAYRAVQPLRLGHVMLFSPNVTRSVAFVIDALGMALADRAQDVVAFCCTRKNSDHHVIAFAKSSGVGFHHASFEVADPDEVGRAGRALHERTGLGEWGFGRHTIGSNFFHYIQDPWGSWFEYYSDMDHIEDSAAWTATNYGMEDSLANWGPPVPKDFVHNYETDSGGFVTPPTSAVSPIAKLDVAASTPIVMQ
jgi:catechol 2,3-dioxygenase-like lactoylglutathione lyase family enzyme